jgi:hypothetical protein
MNYLTNELTIDKTNFFLGGKPFKLWGISFFNVLFNETFNKDEESRLKYLSKFKEYGINTLRIWCQYNFKGEKAGFADGFDHTSLYTHTGEIQERYFNRLQKLLTSAGTLGMIIEIAAFSHERYHQIREWREFPEDLIPMQTKALRALSERLIPYRNIILQIWNECSFEIERYFCIVKSIDEKRIVTNSPGYCSDLGDDTQNRLMDCLSPHTARGDVEKFWETAPKQLESLLHYNKPVYDDEPARCGLIQFGGIPGGTQPWQHIEQIKEVSKLGCGYIYHHDMWQNGYNNPATPPSGIPEPEYSPFHHEVLKFIRDNADKR